MNKELQITDLANRLINSGQFEAAQALCEDALSEHPGLSRIRLPLARCALHYNDFQQAKRHLDGLIDDGIRAPEVFYQLGLSFAGLKKLTKAMRAFHQALDAGMSSVSFYLDISDTASLLDKNKQALGYLEEALKIDPEYAPTYQRIADIQSKLGKTRAASVNYCKAGMLFWRQQRAEAATCFDMCSKFVNNEHEVLENLGVYYHQTGNYDKAKGFLSRAVKLASGTPLYHYNLACLLVDMCEADQAEPHFLKCLELNPDFAQARVNYAKALQLSGKLEQARENYLAVIQARPGNALAQYNMGLLMLGIGELDDGWRQYHWRVMQDTGKAYLQDPRNPRHTLPAPPEILEREWKDRSFCLINDQGLGDILFFLRFIKPLQQRGIHIRWLVQDKLAKVLEHQLENVDILDADSMLERDDIVISSSDLSLFYSQYFSNSYPPPLPLSSNAALRATLLKQLQSLGPPPYIALTWQAGTPRSVLDQRLFKRIDPGILGHKMRNVNATLISIQRNPVSSDTRAFELASGKTLHDFTQLNEDLEAMLALLDVVDDYVGVSNTNMHLRASLGKSASVLIPLPGEWRWLWQGDRSPWFPEFLIYRETIEHGWDAAMKQLQMHFCR